MTAPQPRMLDLSIFTSLDDALEQIHVGDRYIEIAAPILEPFEGRPFGMTYVFFSSMLTRITALHEAIEREARRENPHSVFPLLRAFAETVVVLIYVNDHPEYIGAISDRPDERTKNAPKRKSIQAQISHASKQAPGMKAVYADLSEMTHFGSAALWSPFTAVPREESGAGFEWSSAARWKHPEDALIACALTLELAEAASAFLQRFGVQHLGAPALSEP